MLYQGMNILWTSRQKSLSKNEIRRLITAIILSRFSKRGYSRGVAFSPFKPISISAVVLLDIEEHDVTSIFNHIADAAVQAGQINSDQRALFLK